MKIRKIIKSIISFITSEFKNRPIHSILIIILTAIVLFFVFKGSSLMATGAAISLISGFIGYSIKK